MKSRPLKKRSLVSYYYDERPCDCLIKKEKDKFYIGWKHSYGYNIMYLYSLNKFDIPVTEEYAKSEFPNLFI